MSDTNQPVNVIGTDGNVPINGIQVAPMWKIWALSEIYVGLAGLNKYIPKVNDYVIDTDTNEWYKVLSLDNMFIPKMVKIVSVKDPGDLTTDDILMGPQGGTVSDTYRIYVDKTVLPNTLAVDSRLMVGGSMVSYAQIFRGSVTDGSAQVISGFFNATGGLISQNVPLELVANRLIDNTSIKTVSPCYATQNVNDGEILTIIFYSSDGGVVSKRQLMAVESSFIRQTDTSQKYVVGISLESPFISDSDPRLLQYPMGVPLNGLNLYGVVQYSDGSKLRMPVDGTKFQLFGLDKYISTIISSKAPLVLKYNLSPGEAMYNATSGPSNFITEKYELITVKADGTYSMKLYGYPVWIDAQNGYRLDWFLMNLDRKEYYKVTPLVQINENTAVFNPTQYGTNHRLSVSINLNSVNGAFKNFLHTQLIDIALLRQGTDHSGTVWTIGFEPGQNPPFGRTNAIAMKFVNQNLSHFNIGLGAANQNDWLERAYRQTKPLYNPDQEIAAPDPNMFRILCPSGNTYEYKIDQWNTDIILSELVPDSSTMYIVFFNRTPETDYFLSIGAFPVFQQT